jgi:hypothetical protein
MVSCCRSSAFSAIRSARLRITSAMEPVTRPMVMGLICFDGLLHVADELFAGMQNGLNHAVVDSKWVSDRPA